MGSLLSGKNSGGAEALLLRFEAGNCCCSCLEVTRRERGMCGTGTLERTRRVNLVMR